jgi:Cysteine-rich CPXCG
MALETCSVQCPYCGETIEVDVEPLEEAQSFIEDCTVCCRPIQYEVTTNADDEIEALATRSE